MVYRKNDNASPDNNPTGSSRGDKPEWNRRDFLKAAAAGGLGIARSISHAETAAPPPDQSAKIAGAIRDAVSPSADAFTSAGEIPTGIERTWIGPGYWGNRLQDWRISDGRIECVIDRKERYLNTVSLLTRGIEPGTASGSIRVDTGRINAKGQGYSGILIGAGAGDLDWRAAALVQRGSGIGGGILCVYNPKNNAVEFREHTNEEQPFEWGVLKSDSNPVEATAVDGPVELQLDILPARTDGQYRLILTATQNGKVVSAASLHGAKDADIRGGIMLVSVANSAPDSAQFWFRDVATAGEKIAVHPERTLGPIAGALYSVNGNVLKMTTQLMPIGKSEPHEIALECRTGGGEWIRRSTAKVGDGFTAVFRVDDWDASKDWDYRVIYPAGGDSNNSGNYEGRIRRDPGDDADLRIGLYSCTIATNRLLDRGKGPRIPSWAKFLGRYTKDCICFPFNNLVNYGSYHKPDILFFVGDQFYEDNPSIREGGPEPRLDYLYKWLLWLWGFREMTRRTPTIVLTDDHDVFQPNLFGNGGRPAPDGQYNHGGYRPSAAWVNMMQRTQCGHNPDPYDPTPVKQGISVYYGAFKYGGVDFAFLEDRKWKTAPWQGRSLDVHEGELLGERQERFLEEWGRKVATSDRPRIVATQTIFAGVQTSPAGRPLIDFDCNGYPALNRRRAMELIRDAGALIISGDQHLATVIRNGIDDFTDGPVQFTGPAGAATWTRWFQPAKPLPNPMDTPFTGDFIDAFANKCRVLAVANPDKLTMAEYWSDVKPPTQYIGDRDLKAEGYCLIDVDKAQRQYVLHCWRWDVDPAGAGAKEYDGWPVKVGFDEAGRG